jgi:hypothetical protein
MTKNTKGPAALSRACRQCRKPLPPTARGTVCDRCNTVARAAAERLFRAVGA